MLKLLKAFIAKLSTPGVTTPVSTENLPVETPQPIPVDAETPDMTEILYGNSEMTENLKRLILSAEETHIEMAFQILKGAKHPAVKRIPPTASANTKKIWMCAWFSLPLPERYHNYYSSVILNGCQLNQLPNFLGDLSKKISTLQLAKNQLKEFPESFFYQSSEGWESLNSINLSHNDLSEFPRFLWTRKNLDSIHFSYNRISEIPEIITSLSGLQRLYLGHNQLTQIPGILHKLASLQVLHLAGNQISILPDDIFQNAQLKEFNLSHNTFVDFPKSLLSIHSLRHLNLSCNAIPFVPVDAFLNWTLLRELNLNYNAIQSCSLSQLPNLRYLFLVGNHLSELAIAKGSLPKLRKLHLHHNCLTSLPVHIGDLKQLREVHLYDNKLKSLPDEIGALTRLEYLSLDKNGLTRLPDSVQNLKSLRQLDLTHNPLSDAEKSRIQSWLPHTHIRF